ncbi:MAG TPA: DUF3142 domain-containing protein [Thermoanaerobaculia bacterium]|nr:DUF3142 domain-containing protein [Thermoanaerobaculia bacterium]
MRRLPLTAVLISLAVAFLLLGLWLRRGPRASGPLPQEAYVWQRSWGPEVQAAVRQTEGLSGLVALAAEVDLSVKPPRVALAGIDFAALRASGRPVGLAVRIGRFAQKGPERRLAEDAEAVRFVAGVAREVAARARTAGIPVREIQLDYDCPESRLGEYPILVKAVKTAVAPLPVTITALPAWLRQRRDFAALAAAADGYVLQVHSLAAPRRFDAAFLLCDPVAAKQAVEAAARFRRPFRVALPTYGYVVAFDRNGKVVGLSAEGPLLSWPRDAVVRMARSDPAAMAGLVRAWSANRPAELSGLLWYRLPSAADRLNWPWPALRAVMAGRQPRRELHSESHLSSPELVDVELVNGGEEDMTWPTPVTVTWSGAALSAADGLASYQISRDGESRILLQRDLSAWDRPLRPGERRQIAWLRFTGPAQVRNVR